MPSRVEVLQTQLPAYNRLRTKYEAELIATAKKMTAPGKGLLASDETIESFTDLFASWGLPNTAENRRQHHAFMLECEGLEQYLSGVILREETLTQKAGSGETFPQLLTRKGVVVGVNTDKGLHPLIEGVEGEEKTEGLDGYEKRAKKYYKAGCRFCKWRNVYKIQNGTVSEAAVRFNAETLARYAILSQKSGLVPIVEPEVMLQGSHDIETSQRISQHVWAEVVSALHRHGVIWEGCVLKPSMVVPGSKSGTKASPEEVARYTVGTLARVLPPALPGAMFLSGGLSELEGSEYLNAINRSPLPHPWLLSFCYGRALKASALKAWGGKESGLGAAQRAFLHRCRMCALATRGKYRREDDNL